MVGGLTGAIGGTAKRTGGQFIERPRLLVKSQMHPPDLEWGAGMAKPADGQGMKTDTESLVSVSEKI